MSGCTPSSCIQTQPAINGHWEVISGRSIVLISMCICVCLTLIGEFYLSGFLFAAFAELLDNAVDEVFVAFA